MTPRSAQRDNRLGPYELNRIYTGDARELAKGIPDESVDLIFTDPVYQNIDDYHWLAETAARVLKPDRACLAFCGIGYLPETLDALRTGGLNYRWTMPHLTPGTGGYCDMGPSRWMCCLWFDKGHTVPSPRLYDVAFTNGITDWHIWRKNVAALIRMLNSWSDSLSVVLDPFTGGGTVPAVCKMLGRNYLAFEICPDTAELARERVRNTQPPLFVPMVEQVGMELQCPA